MSDNYRFALKVGEIGKQIQFTIKDENGATVSLTGKTCTFSMKKGSTVAIENGACTNDPDQTANKGVTVYTFGTEVNTLAAGIYTGEVAVEDGGGNVTIYPNSTVPSRNYLTIVVSASI